MTKYQNAMQMAFDELVNASFLGFDYVRRYPAFNAIQWMALHAIAVKGDSYDIHTKMLYDDEE